MKRQFSTYARISAQHKGSVSQRKTVGQRLCASFGTGHARAITPTTSARCGGAKPLTCTDEFSAHAAPAPTCRQPQELESPRTRLRETALRYGGPLQPPRDRSCSIGNTLPPIDNLLSMGGVKRLVRSVLAPHLITKNWSNAHGTLPRPLEPVSTTRTYCAVCDGKLAISGVVMPWHVATVVHELPLLDTCTS